MAVVESWEHSDSAAVLFPEGRSVYALVLPYP